MDAPRSVGFLPPYDQVAPGHGGRLGALIGDGLGVGRQLVRDVTVDRQLA